MATNSTQEDFYTFDQAQLDLTDRQSIRFLSLLSPRDLNIQFYHNPNIYYIMIHIELPFIKDKRVYLGLKDNHNVKIIKRTFEQTLNMPCTQTN